MYTTTLFLFYVTITEKKKFNAILFCFLTSIKKRLLIFKFCYGLPPNAFIIISVEMCKCSRTHICSSIRSLHGITTSNTHVPKNHSSSSFFLPLNLESTFFKISTHMITKLLKIYPFYALIGNLQSSKENFSEEFLCNIKGNICSLRYFSLCLRFSQPYMKTLNFLECACRSQ